MATTALLTELFSKITYYSFGSMRSDMIDFLRAFHVTQRSARSYWNGVQQSEKRLTKRLKFLYYLPCGDCFVKNTYKYSQLCRETEHYIILYPYVIHILQTRIVRVKIKLFVPKLSLTSILNISTGVLKENLIDFSIH